MYSSSIVLLLLSAIIGAAAVPASAPASVPTDAATPTPTPTTFVISAPTAPPSTSHCYLHITAHAGDSCASIAAVFNIDIASFRRMNPGIDCSHLKGEYCVADGSVAAPSRSSSQPSPPKASSPSSPPPSSTSPSAPTQPPHPVQSPITPACRSWHLVASGDTCARIEQALGISDADFRKWNGFLDDDCTNLWLDYYCCVGV